ncbi:hypothetical protein [Selenomonas ruminantium]|uniref:Cell division protein FtsZ n=1 Tax=Selenomonas ruminantium TaxID=971 RepID=A0A1H0NJ06_SELRU|nr:hypothetical protein [Selenomonas ruminantium]SDO92538.1 cell division protein FtsZ [Selenomonas ruminantium]
MFELNENTDEKGCDLRVALIGKTAEIWKRQKFAEEFKLLEGNPLEPSTWRSIDICFLIGDVREKEDVNKFKQAVAANKDKSILLITILISEEQIELPAPLMTINPEKYAGESEIYKGIYYAIKSIYDIVCIPGLVNLDLCDVQTVCKDKKSLLIATGEAEGEKASIIAAMEAVNKLTKQNEKAQSVGTSVLLNVTGSEANLSMYEIQEASETILDWMENKQAAIIWGSSIDESLDDVIRVSILIGE